MGRHESVRTVLQELVEFEAATVNRADRSERTEDRDTERNGTRPKLIDQGRRRRLSGEARRMA